MQKAAIDRNNVKASAQVLRAVNHEMRQKILSLLDRHQEMSVTDLYVKLKSEQSVISGHLGTLRRIGIVSRRRNKKQVFYSVVESRILEINTYAAALSQFVWIP